MKYEWIEDYLMDKKGVKKDFKVEWQWHRYQIMNKLFAAICHDKDGKHIVSLKCDPTLGSMLRGKYPDIMPGFYMNKVHWNSVDLNGKVPTKILKDMIDQSYQLILASLSKKLQKEITGE